MSNFGLSPAAPIGKGTLYGLSPCGAQAQVGSDELGLQQDAATIHLAGHC